MEPFVRRVTDYEILRLLDHELADVYFPVYVLQLREVADRKKRHISEAQGVYLEDLDKIEELE